jgi:hypothetical protein
MQRGGSSTPSPKKASPSPRKKQPGAAQPLQDVSTSNIGKYQLGQHVSGLAGGTISGEIVTITPNVAGQTSGPGKLAIGQIGHTANEADCDSTDDDDAGEGVHLLYGKLPCDERANKLHRSAKSAAQPDSLEKPLEKPLIIVSESDSEEEEEEDGFVAQAFDQVMALSGQTSGQMDHRHHQQTSPPSYVPPGGSTTILSREAVPPGGSTTIM